MLREPLKVVYWAKAVPAAVRRRRSTRERGLRIDAFRCCGQLPVVGMKHAMKGGTNAVDIGVYDISLTSGDRFEP